MDAELEQKKARMEILWKELRELARKYDVAILTSSQRVVQGAEWLTVSPEPSAPAIIFFDYLGVTK